jgi:hypothetical protein
LYEAEKGGFTVTLPPQELVIVRVPVVGGFDVVIVPVKLKVLVPGLQAPGVAVIAVILHKIAQFVAPVLPEAVVAEILVG